MQNLMKFFMNSYELDSSISFEDPDPLVEKMKDEIRNIIQKKGKNVVEVTAEYEEFIDSIDVKLDDKILRLTGDDNGTPCIDILELPDQGSWGYGKIISTSYIETEKDLEEFINKL